MQKVISLLLFFILVSCATKPIREQSKTELIENNMKNSLMYVALNADFNTGAKCFKNFCQRNKKLMDLIMPIYKKSFDHDDLVMDIKKELESTTSKDQNLKLALAFNKTEWLRYKSFIMKAQNIRRDEYQERYDFYMEHKGKFKKERDRLIISIISNLYSRNFEEDLNMLLIKEMKQLSEFQRKKMEKELKAYSKKTRPHVLANGFALNSIFLEEITTEELKAVDEVRKSEEFQGYLKGYRRVVVGKFGEFFGSLKINVKKLEN